ncbi:hypothetical protein, partial [Rhodopseudomonas palustris]|uniref:hypothetical protein n=1 Tax=Rhodopseudomonas palustris TaxID=1076 RepID=UPI001A9EF45E
MPPLQPQPLHGGRSGQAASPAAGHAQTKRIAAHTAKRTRGFLKLITSIELLLDDRGDDAGAHRAAAFADG